MVSRRNLYTWKSIDKYHFLVSLEQSFDLRDKVVNFSGNNVVTGEEHLRIFIDMLNDYEVEHEDVVMKLFVHSLTEDVRDWFRRLPDDSITSWSDLEKLFKEQYGDNTNT